MHLLLVHRLDKTRQLRLPLLLHELKREVGSSCQTDPPDDLVLVFADEIGDGSEHNYNEGVGIVCLSKCSIISIGK